VKAMRYIALTEATSFLALLVASYVKRTGGYVVDWWLVREARRAGVPRG